MSFLDDLYAGYAGGQGSGDFYGIGKMLGNTDPVASGLRSGTGSAADRAAQMLGLQGQTTGPFAVDNYSAKATAAAGADPAMQAQARDAQDQLLAQLQAQSTGQGPSIAQQQLGDATNRTLQGSMAMLASQKGGTPGMANYYASQNQAGAQQQAAGQSAMERLQEQLQARGLLGQVASGMRGQDLDLANLSQQNNQFNAGQQNTMTGQQNQFIGGQEMARNQANLQSRNDAMNQLYSFMGKLPGAGAGMFSKGAAAGAGA